ncbi:MAG: hypothetical protein KC442_08625 [Thermomicrobiales bacterium]|nr:hypothetical protein [Thermomicrobiales bacterium]
MPSPYPGANTLPANRAGRRVGQVSELTVIAPLKPGGADYLRSLSMTSGADGDGLMGIHTVHNLRWVIFDNDTRAIFATTYDGDWDAYIDDFATGIPDQMDAMFGVVEGYPGITAPNIKDFIAAHQITATTWFAAHPDLRVTDVERQARLAHAVDGLLDASNP